MRCFVAAASASAVLLAAVGLTMCAPMRAQPKASGAPQRFEVASIRPAKPGSFFLPNFPLGPDDSYVARGGYLRADFPLEVYIEFAYKLWPSSQERNEEYRNLPEW
jgi:hypothetical protein